MAITATSARQSLTTATETTVFTAGAGGAVISNIVVSNTSATLSSTIAITLNDASTGKIHIVDNVNVTPGTSLFYDIKQHLAASKSVFFTAGTANVLDVHVSGVNL